MLGDSLATVNPTKTAAGSRSTTRKPSERTDRIASAQLQRVRQYVVGVLRGEMSASSGLQPAISRSIGPSAYTALLPTIWALIDGEASEKSNPHEDVFTAVLEHATRASSTSAVKRHTVEFVGRILLVSQMPRRLDANIYPAAVDYFSRHPQIIDVVTSLDRQSET